MLRSARVSLLPGTPWPASSQESFPRPPAISTLAHLSRSASRSFSSPSSSIRSLVLWSGRLHVALQRGSPDEHTTCHQPTSGPSPQTIAHEYNATHRGELHCERACNSGDSH